MEDLTHLKVHPTRFKEAREKKKLTQEQVAQAVGVQKAAISKLECGTGMPSADVLARLCILLEVTIEDLARDSTYAIGSESEPIGATP